MKQQRSDYHIYHSGFSQILPVLLALNGNGVKCIYIRSKYQSDSCCNIWKSNMVMVSVCWLILGLLMVDMVDADKNYVAIIFV